MSNSAQTFEELTNLLRLIHEDTNFLQLIDKISDVIVQAYKNGNKTIFCGNGGSSAEAQHLAAELSGKFKLNRKPIAAEACHVNSSFVTAVSNDYDFTKVYARYVEGYGKKGDVLIGLSTSGTSPNIVEAFKMAQKMGITTVALSGKTGGKLAKISNYILKIPAVNVPRIQEVHLLIGHIICEKVEQQIFGNEL